MPKKLTNEIVDDRLKGSDIIRLGNYVNGNTPIDFKCLLDDNIWETTPSNILNKNTGCPLCSTPGLNQKLLYSVLKENNIPFEHKCNIRKINSKEKRNLRFDFYLPQIKTAIEYDGKQHFKPHSFGSDKSQRIIDENFTDLQTRDLYKNS